LGKKEEENVQSEVEDFLTFGLTDIFIDESWISNIKS